jgi:hypothetical protein
MAARKKQRRQREGGNKVPVLARFDPDVLARIETAARALGVSRAVFVAMAAVEKVAAWERENR